MGSFSSTARVEVGDVIQQAESVNVSVRQSGLIGEPTGC